MWPVPARLFALHVEAQRVASIQELRVGRVVAEAYGIHVHALYQQHVLDVLLFRERAARLRTERMTVGTLHDDFLPVDEEAVLLVAVVLVAILDGTETEALAFRMEGLTRCIFQGEDSGIEVGLLGIPCLDTLGLEVHLRAVAGNGEGGARGYLLAFVVDQIDDHSTAGHGAVQEDVGHEVAVVLSIDSYALYVLCGLRDDEDGTPDAAEVPVVSTALGEVHLWLRALLQHLHLQSVFLLAEEHAVADVDGMACKATLVGAVTGLTSVDLHTNLGEGSLEHQLYLSALPLLG